MRMRREARVRAVSSYLAGGHELERAQRGLHVRDVLLEVVESIGNAGLDLGGALPRGAVGSDLVQGGRHGCGLLFDGRSGRVERGRSSRVAVEVLRAVDFTRAIVPMTRIIVGPAAPCRPFHHRCQAYLADLLPDQLPLRVTHSSQIRRPISGSLNISSATISPKPSQIMHSLWGDPVYWTPFVGDRHFFLSLQASNRLHGTMESANDDRAQLGTEFKGQAINVHSSTVSRQPLQEIATTFLHSFVSAL